MKSCVTAIAISAVLWAAAALDAPRCAADMVSLTASRDNTLIEDAEGARSNALGTGVFVGRTDMDGLRRAVIAFDVAATLPQDAIVESATLTLTRTSGLSNPSLLVVHRLLADWGEGTSVFNGGQGAASTPGDATWVHAFYDTVAWPPGGDFDGTPSAATFDQVGNEISWSTLGLDADVQRWIDDPSSEFGWIVIGNEVDPMNTIRFASREIDTPAAPPTLTIVFSVPEPTQLWLHTAAIGALAGVRRLRARAAGPEESP